MKIDLKLFERVHTYTNLGYITTVMPEFKRICIIGAGPTGLAALQATLESPQFTAGLWKPTLFEQKANVGGVWCSISSTYTPPLG